MREKNSTRLGIGSERVLPNPRFALLASLFFKPPCHIAMIICWFLANYYNMPSTVDNIIISVTAHKLTLLSVFFVLSFLMLDLISIVRLITDDDFAFYHLLLIQLRSEAFSLIHYNMMAWYRTLFTSDIWHDGYS